MKISVGPTDRSSRWRRSLALAVLLLSGTADALGQEAATEQGHPPRVRILGFGDFNFSATDQRGVQSSSGFDEGQFVLHFVSALTSRVNFFGEVSLTAKDDEFDTEVERAIVEFEHSDLLQVGLGRFHTPLTWWNTAFHHGQWLQTTIDRPSMTRFGGQFIPVHFVGAVGEGAIPSGGVNLNWEAGLGNGRGENIARGGDDGDVNNNRAWIVRLSARPDAVFPLEVGAAHYRDRISAQPGLEDFRESISSAFVAWTRENPEVIAEYARLRREGVDSAASFSSDAYYVQAAYRLGCWGSRLKPYARVERIDVADADPVFDRETDVRQHLVGLRLDAALYAAVKVEYRRQRTDQEPPFDAIHAQVSFTF